MSLEYDAEDTILDQYVVRDVKRGGFGIVYICYSYLDQQMVAIKSFQDKFFYRGDKRADKVVEDFYREAETWVKLEKHKNIVTAFFVRPIDYRPHIFLEYVDKGNLEDYLTEGRLDLSQSLDFAIQFCDGMIYSNWKELGESKRGIVHRDIKPANIMLTKAEVLKITDFGLVKALGVPSAERPAGTPEYMSPEQFETMDVDQRSDIYSFGVVLYQMLTGQPPFYISTKDNKDRWEFCKEYHKETDPTGLRYIDSSIPKALEEMVLKCLEKRPDDRYQNFDELRTGLMEIYRSLFGQRPEIETRIQSLTMTELYNAGISLAYLGKFDDAISYFDKVLEKEPRCEVWVDKGHCLAEEGRLEEAIKCFDKAIEMSPNYADAWDRKGDALYYLGFDEWTYRSSLDSLKHFGKALKCYDKALQINNAEPALWTKKGTCLQNMGAIQHIREMVEEAIWCYDNAIRLERARGREYLEAWHCKGDALNALLKYEEAIQCFDMALKINPRYAEAWASKGVSLMFLKGKTDEAMNCLKRAVKLKPVLERRILKIMHAAYRALKKE